MQDAMSIRKIPTRSPGLAPSCLNFHGFPMVGMVIQFMVGVYIRIIIIKGGMTIPHYKEFRPWHK